MSAVLKDTPRLASMAERDLDGVMAIEEAIYSHPWTRGNFADSLRAGYECHTLCAGRELIGYFVLMVAAGEAHLLNLSIAARYQRGGYIKRLPEDPWGRAYQYASPGQHGEADVWTLGADGAEGGEGINADIGSWI